MKFRRDYISHKGNEVMTSKATAGFDPVTCNNWHMAVTFTVKDQVSDTPRIMVEHLDGPVLPILQEGLLGLDLQKETTLDEAEELAAMLRKHVKHLTLTADGIYIAPGETLDIVEIIPHIEKMN